MHAGKAKKQAWPHALRLWQGAARNVFTCGNLLSMKIFAKASCKPLKDMRNEA